MPNTCTISGVCARLLDGMSNGNSKQQRVCSVEGCDEPMKTRGWCHMHYTRWQRHGDPHYDKSRSGKGWIKNGIGYIPLTKGKVAMVDPEDVEWLSQWKWYADSGRYTWNGRYTWYAKRKSKFGGGTIPMHRFILGLKKGDGKKVDHRFGNGLDNRKSKIRICTITENAMNRRKFPGKSSKYKGVYFNKRDKSWKCGIRHNYQSYFLGTFKNEKVAAEQYDIAAQIFFGEFAKLNFPLPK